MYGLFLCCIYVMFKIEDYNRDRDGLDCVSL